MIRMDRNMKSLGQVAIGLVVFLCVAMTSAQEVTSQSAQEEAASRFERGVALYEDGALDAALVEFERAYELVSDYRVLYNIAHVQTERHHYAEAVRLYERYLKEGGAEIDEQRRSAVETDLSILRTHIARLWVESNVNGAELFVDDQSVGRLPLTSPVLINPGLCRLRLEKPGFETVTQTIKVAGGESPRVMLSMTSGLDEPLSERRGTNASSPPPAQIAKKNYVPFWLTAGGAVVLGGTAAAFGAIAASTDNKVDDEFDRQPADREEIDNLQSQGQTYSWVADGLGVAALVSAGFSIYFLVNPPKKKSTIPVGKIRLELQPTALGARLHGTF